MEPVQVEFIPLPSLERGGIMAMLESAYGNPGQIPPEAVVFWRHGWQAYDDLVFNDPHGAGAAGFVARVAGIPVGFVSWDPREYPELAVLGHNCVLPEYRGRGIGTTQVREAVRRLKGAGFRRAATTTGAGPFFAPARRMYEKCGFVCTGRGRSGGRFGMQTLEYGQDLEGPRIARERRTVVAMVRMFCRDRHHSSDTLCPECRDLLGYAVARLVACPFGERKPACSKCTVHCYRPAERESMRTVMRHSGPWMVLEHPILAILHVMDGFRGVPRGKP